MTPEEINKALQLAYDTGFKHGRAEENEASARIAEQHGFPVGSMREHSYAVFGEEIAAAIRARVKSGDE